MRWVSATACAVFLVVAAPAHAAVFNAPRGVSAFKVPRGVTSIKVTAVGESGGGQGGLGREVVRTISVTPGQPLTLRVGTGGGSGAFSGGGLSGVFGTTPLVVAAGGGGAGASGPGMAAGAGTTLTQSDGGAGTSGGGGGGAGYLGGAGGVGGSGGAGGSSHPVAGVLAAGTAPTLALEYEDADAPQVSLDAPAPLNPSYVEGSAGTEGGDAAAVSVRLFMGDRPVGEPVSTSNVGVTDGRFTSALTSLSDGVWTVQAVQHDIAGHEGFSEPVTFVVDWTGPKLQITSPGPVTGDPSTAIDGVAGTEPGDLEEVTVTVTGPNGFSETVVAPVHGETFQAVLAEPLADGTYKVLARQVDEYQHVGTATSTFVVDTVAPTLTLDGPEGDVTAVTFSGTASESGDVFISVDRRTLRAPVVNGAYAASITLPDGTYTATARFTDPAGNLAEATRSFRVVTPVPPVIATVVHPVVVTPLAVIRTPLKITKATRRGRTVTVRGTAPGTVSVRVGGVTKRVKPVGGAWSATFRLRRAQRVTVTVAYERTTVRKSVT